MNKTLEEEELDRELVLKHTRMNMGNGRTYDSVIKASVGKRKFKLQSKFQDGKEIDFRRCADGDLDIILRIKEKKTVVCSLGHKHEIESDQMDYHFFQLPTEHVESLIGWLQDGGWVKAEKRESRERKALRATLDFIEQIPKDSIVRPAAMKLKTKINDILIPWIEDLQLKEQE